MWGQVNKLVLIAFLSIIEAILVGTCFGKIFPSEISDKLDFHVVLMENVGFYSYSQGNFACIYAGILLIVWCGGGKTGGGGLGKVFFFLSIYKRMFDNI